MNWLGRVCRADFLLRYGLRFGGEAAWLRVFEIAPSHFQSLSSIEKDAIANFVKNACKAPAVASVDGDERAGAESSCCWNKAAKAPAPNPCCGQRR